jgi:hypothetical protein
MDEMADHQTLGSPSSRPAMAPRAKLGLISLRKKPAAPLLIVVVRAGFFNRFTKKKSGFFNLTRHKFYFDYCSFYSKMTASNNPSLTGRRPGPSTATVSSWPASDHQWFFFLTATKCLTGRTAVILSNNVLI